MQGFANLGSTCYINAFVACLCNTHWVKSRCAELAAVTPFRELFNDIQAADSHGPIRLNQLAAWVKGKLGNGAQCTAELADLFMDGIPKSLLPDVETSVKQVMVCQSCHNQTEQSQQVSLLITELDGITPSRETIAGFVCDTCRACTTAFRTVDHAVSDDQKLLVMVVPRPPGKASTAIPWLKTVQLDGFRLVGYTICTGGHHVAVTRNGPGWRLHDDTSVRSIDGEAKIPLAHVLVLESVN